MKADWRAVVGILITVLLLWWVLRGVELAVLWAEIRSADFGLLGLAVAIATATYFLRAVRWEVLLQPIRPGTSLGGRWAAVNIGFMANNLLPARVGEFARAYALARLESTSVSGAFATLVVERFLDALTIAFLLMVAMLAPGFPENPTWGDLSLTAILQGVAILMGGLLTVMVLMLLFPRPVVRIVSALARHLPGENTSRLVVDALEAFLEGLKVLQRPRLLVLAVLWSLGVWLWQSLAFWVGFRAFGIDVGYDAALFVNGVVAFFVGVPAAPGFFGTFQAGALLGLGVYGVAAAPTLAFAFGFHLGGFIPVTLLGLYYAWRLGLSLREVETSETRVEEAVEASRPAPGGAMGERYSSPRNGL